MMPQESCPTLGTTPTLLLPRHCHGAPRKLLLDCPSLGNPNTSACMADARLTWLTWSTSRPPHPRQQPHLHLSLRRRLDHNACSILSSHQVGTMGVLKPAMLGPTLLEVTMQRAEENVPESL